MSNINGVNAFDLICEDLVFVRAAFKNGENEKLYDYKLHKTQIEKIFGTIEVDDTRRIRELLVGKFAIVQVANNGDNDWSRTQWEMRAVKIVEVCEKAEVNFQREYGTRFMVQLIDDQSFKQLNDLQAEFVKDFNKQRNKAVQSQIMNAMFGDQSQIAQFQSRVAQLTKELK